MAALARRTYARPARPTGSVNAFLEDGLCGTGRELPRGGTADGRAATTHHRQAAVQFPLLRLIHKALPTGDHPAPYARSDGHLLCGVQDPVHQPVPLRLSARRARRVLRSYRRTMDHWHAVIPGVILDVTYEQLVSDAEGRPGGCSAVVDWHGRTRCSTSIAPSRPRRRPARRRSGNRSTRLR